MKTLLLTLTAAAAITTAAFCIHRQITLSDDPLFANVEALTDDESNDQYAICYSESQVRKGATYYDCGTCEKVYDEKGKGTYSKCFF